LSQILDCSEWRQYRCPTGNRSAIAHRSEPAPPRCERQHALGAGPRLLPELAAEAEGFVAIANGQVVRDALGRDRRHARSALGLAADGTLILAMARQTPEGVSLPELAQFLQEQGAIAALNLDGGRSSSLDYRGDTFSGQGDASGQLARSFPLRSGDRRPRAPVQKPGFSPETHKFRPPTDKETGFFGLLTWGNRIGEGGLRCGDSVGGLGMTILTRSIAMSDTNLTDLAAAIATLEAMDAGSPVFPSAIQAAIAQLEAQRQRGNLQQLAGCWRLVWTSGSGRFLPRAWQCFDLATSDFANRLEFPLGYLSASSRFSYTPRQRLEFTVERIAVKFGSLQFGVPLGAWAKGWLQTTYLDGEWHLERGDRGGLALYRRDRSADEPPQRGTVI